MKINLESKLTPFREPIDPYNNNRLREFLVSMRLINNFTQRDLAKKLKVHRSLVRKIENGERRIDAIELVLLSKTLDFSITEYYSYILNGYTE